MHPLGPERGSVQAEPAPNTVDAEARACGHTTLLYIFSCSICTALYVTTAIAAMKIGDAFGGSLGLGPTLDYMVCPSIFVAWYYAACFFIFNLVDRRGLLANVNRVYLTGPWSDRLGSEWTVVACRDGGSVLDMSSGAHAA